MTPDRWRQIERVYEEAVGRRGAEREAYLGEACNADAELRREVERMLSGENRVGSFLETPAAVRSQLRSGARIGPYEVLSLLGAGGMGEVYKAHDPRLNRTVAIKVLPAYLAGDAERRKRLLREARAASALNNPHIITVYDVVSDNGHDSVVMEYLEGPTLAEAIGRTGLALQKVLEYGGQIAGALAAAHGAGIIHRDLKPGNLMLTKSGIKVLDFGLARSAGDETLTASQVVMGTPAYMAPEQRSGAECDGRTDIYSLGLVLREMATGIPSGRGQSMPASIPEKLGHVIDRCLRPDPDQRWQSARDVQAELEWAGLPAEQAAGPAPGGLHWWPVAALAAAVLTAAFVIAFRAGGADARVFRFSIPPPPDAEFLCVPNRVGLALSPDGRKLVFLAERNRQRRLWVQSLDSQSARELAGTDNASFPFWAPDGRSIAFFAGGHLNRIDVDGTNLQVLADAYAARSGFWGAKDMILFSRSNLPGSPIYRVSAAGGKAEAFTAVDRATDETYHSLPKLLRDGTHFMYLANGQNWIYIGSLADRNFKKRLMPGAWVEPSRPMTSGPDYMIWNREDDTIVAQRWDSGSLQLLGEPTPLGGPVGLQPFYANFTVSDSGALVYGGQADMELEWVDRAGRTISVLGEHGHIEAMKASPDGERAAALFRQNALVVIDRKRGVTSRIGTGGGTVSWSPDGRQIGFTRKRQIVVINADGGAEKVVRSGSLIGWTPDGRGFLYTEEHSSNPYARRLKLATFVAPEAGRTLVGSDHDEEHGVISTDGRWLVYASDESGRYEVYVRRLDAGSGEMKTQVSYGGGEYPEWRRDGGELFYRAPDSTLMSVTVKPVSNGLEFSAPQRLFPLPSSYVSESSYDVSRDGQQFLVIAPHRPHPREPLNVIVNWPALLKKETAQ